MSSLEGFVEARLGGRTLRLVRFEWAGSRELMLRLAARLEAVFRVSVQIDAEELSLAECFDPARAQYDSRRVLGRLTELSEGSWVLGLTGVDLFLSVFTFVLGEARLDGPAAVVSTFRLQEELYGLPADAALSAQRLEKECIHELGHCHGLYHCLDSRCVMYAATTVEDVDLRGAAFCEPCAGRLRGRLPAR